ncbi:MAG: O-antigen ligase family protein [Aminipila sp.]
MAKKNTTGQKNVKSKIKTIDAIESIKNSGYSFSMSMSPKIDEGLHWFQMLPIAFFTAFIIIIVRLYQYNRPMSQFYWTNGGNDLVEFFSYYKMSAIIICSVFAILIIMYRVFCQSLAIKRSILYIPILIYSLFVLLSYLMSDYKEFALFGFNDRFEGTIPLIFYMIMLFYIINTVNDEKSVKWVIYPTAISSLLLCLLGVSQSLGKDFFQTTLGKKLITPSWFWSNLDTLQFTFKDGEIYQTVYNINYVSFYLTLLIPLFGLLFIHYTQFGKGQQTINKVVWGFLFALTMYNLIGSKSSGGFLGMAVVILIAILLLNKTIISWWKPITMLLTITILVGGLTYERWLPEISGAISSVLGIERSSTFDDSSMKEFSSLDESTPNQNKGIIDYIETSGNNVIFSYNGNKITFTTYPNNPKAVKLTDASGKDLDIAPTDEKANIFTILDERFPNITLGPVKDSAGINYLIIKTDNQEWPFAIMEGYDVRYRNDLGKLMPLKKIPAIGWEDNQGFGSGRGYIWSRTIPMMKDTFFIGRGADTYCIYFPQDDYAGKYNANWESINTIVDKPHNMYMGSWVGTGGISVLALLALWLIYIIQSINIFWKRDFKSFIEYTGLGIFLGICGFLISGLVNDSTVSVMPMFYGLLGTGISINIMLKRNNHTN